MRLFKSRRYFSIICPIDIEDKSIKQSYRYFFLRTLQLTKKYLTKNDKFTVTEPKYEENWIVYKCENFTRKPSLENDLNKKFTI